LRRRSHGNLNKGECRHALARAVFFHRLGELRDRAAEAMAYWASGLNLVVNAIILWNTTYLARGRRDTCASRASDSRMGFSHMWRRSSGPTSHSPATMSGPRLSGRANASDLCARTALTQPGSRILSVQSCRNSYATPSWWFQDQFRLLLLWLVSFALSLWGARSHTGKFACPASSKTRRLWPP
jgi:hypothetical protein